MSAERLIACDMSTLNGLSVRIRELRSARVTVLAAAALYHIVYPASLGISFSSSHRCK